MLPTLVEPDVATILKNVRAQVARKHCRVDEFFKDFNKLNTGKVTDAQFRRAFSMADIKLSRAALTALARAYTDEFGEVNYKRACADINQQSDDLARFPERPVPALGASGIPEFGSAFASEGDATTYTALLERLQKRAETQRLMVKEHFRDFDRHNRGYVTESRFRAALPQCFKMRFTDAELGLLVTAFAMRSSGDTTGKRDINYRALSQAIKNSAAGSAATADAAPEFCRLVEPGATATAAKLEAGMIERVLQRRVQVKGLFRDYDKLRSGFITVDQFMRVLTCEGLCISQNTADLRLLADLYVQRTGPKAGLVAYMRCVEVIDKAYSVALTASKAGKPAQVDIAETEYLDTCGISDVVRAQVKLALNGLRRVMADKRFTMVDDFRDFDRRHTNHVTDGQFMRVLGNFGLVPNPVTERQASALLKTYCNEKKDKELINYALFLSHLGASTTSASAPEVAMGDTLRRTVSTVSKTAPLLDAVMLKLKTQAKKNRIRAKTFLEDFDMLRSGVITAAQLSKGLSTARFNITPSEVAVLIEYYAQPDTFDAAGKSLVAWTRFVDDLETPFTMKYLERTPTADVVAFTQESYLEDINDPLDRLSSEEEGVVRSTLDAIHESILRYRIDITRPFKDFDRHNRGVITKGQFCRALKQYLSVQEADMKLLCKTFQQLGGDLIDYKLFIRATADVNDVLGNKTRPARPYFPEVDESSQRQVKYKAPHGPVDIDALIKSMAATARRRRVRVKDFLASYDKLRHGHISIAKFRSALAAAGFDLKDAELEALEQLFAHESVVGTVKYMALADRLNERLLRGGDEPAPVPSESVVKSLSLIKTTVVKLRLSPKSYFQTRDRNNQGVVTKLQFNAILDFMNVFHVISKADLKDLQNFYTSAKSTDAVDYLRFCQDVTPAL
jgi:Ca2+-binding EF-hand superfamily protein